MIFSGAWMARGEGGMRDAGHVMQIRTALLLASSVSMMLLAGTAGAGGLYVNELSTTSQGNAGAGRGAWVPDASATLHNPASMTRLKDHGFAGGLSLVPSRAIRSVACQYALTSTNWARGNSLLRLGERFPGPLMLPLRSNFVSEL